MIQLIGLRPTNDKSGKRREVNWGLKYTAPSLRKLFKDPDIYLKDVPEAERWNLYFTVNNCIGNGSRDFKSCEALWFDIDGVDESQTPEPDHDLIKRVAETAVSSLKLKWDQTVTIFTGGGVQLFLGLNTPIEDPDYFELHRPHYKLLCSKIEGALKKAGLPGEMDPSVFDSRRIMRMPNTLSKKPSKRADRRTYLLQNSLVPIEYDLVAITGMPKLQKKEHLPKEGFNHVLKFDLKGIEQECEFVKWAINNQHMVTEPQWYALASIARGTDGREYFHKWSENHPGYSREETDEKYDQAMENSGPRTCENLEHLGGKCAGCKYQKDPQVKSPVSITTSYFMRTEDTGFHSGTTDENGKPKKGKPCYEDLRRRFDLDHKYITMSQSGSIYIYNGKHWEPIDDASVKEYAYRKFRPAVQEKVRSEFLNLLSCTNLKSPNWFIKSTERKINFLNGVLIIDNEGFTFEGHSPEHGFRYVLPYEYDEIAECPRFDAFLDDITCGREELRLVIEEFIGYAFSGDTPWLQKAVLLHGEGQNGKSTLIDLVKALAGQDNYSGLNLKELYNEQSRYMLDGKLFNICDENPMDSFRDSTVFKNLVTGGEYTIKEVYKKPYRVKCNAKFIMSMNTLPQTKDITDAFFRRIVLIPFDAKFEGKKCDPRITEKLLEELPGIFNRVMQGYLRLIRQGGLTKSAVIDDTLKNYAHDTDNVIMYMQDKVKVHTDGTDNCHIVRDDLYDKYKNFCSFGNFHPVTMNEFFRRVKRYIPHYEDRLSRPQIDGERKYVVRGIQYQSDNEIDF